MDWINSNDIGFLKKHIHEQNKQIFELRQDIKSLSVSSTKRDETEKTNDKSDKQIFDEETQRMKIKILDKIIYDDLLEKVEEDPKLINTDERFIKIAEGYITKQNKLRSRFSLNDFPYMMITLNPPDSIDWGDIAPLVDTFIYGNTKNYKTMSGIWCYEQRGLNIDDIKGFHCHILLHRNDKSKFKRIRSICLNNFKVLWNKSPDFDMLNLKYVKGEHKQRYVNYICGVKKDNNKKKKHSIDVELRNILEYDQIYRSDEHFDKEIDIAMEMLHSSGVGLSELIVEHNKN